MRIWNRRQFVALATMLPGCRRRSDTGSVDALRVSVSPQPSMAGLYLAYESGYFKDQGLSIELVVLNGGSAEAIPLLAGWRLETSFAPLTPAMINARTRGARLRLVAGREIVALNCSDYGVIYGNRRFFPNGLADLRELKGKRIAVSRPGGTTFFALDVILS